MWKEALHGCDKDKKRTQVQVAAPAEKLTFIEMLGRLAVVRDYSVLAGNLVKTRQKV